MGSPPSRRLRLATAAGVLAFLVGLPSTVAVGCGGGDGVSSSASTSDGSTGSGTGGSSGSASTSTADGNPSSTGSGGSAASAGGGGGSGPTNCDPTSGAVGDSCGIFVSSSSGNDDAPGTMEKPVRSLGHALVLAGAQGGAVYACAEEFDEAVALPAGTTLHGALKCADGWAYDVTSPSTLAGPADQVTLTLEPGSASSVVSDFAITSADATADGGSSIAVFASNATASLERCAITAGRGADGSAGHAQGTPVTPDTANGGAGASGCTSNANVQGGPGGQNSCDGMTVFGGDGGTGKASTSGVDGTDGLPPGGTFPKDGIGGNAQNLSPTKDCSAGDGGYAGAPGTSGAGATGLGSISATGYQSPAASGGMTKGAFGQGGGGGGGAAQCMMVFAGQSGGGGGAGGCGGSPGFPGTSGGASIGVASFNSTLTIQASVIATSTGGAGGLGGDGQVGALGGQPGVSGGGPSCGGGKGGSGGRGGSGGGGAGGSSLGIAFVGTLPVTSSVMITPGTAGAGAVGGDSDATAKGDDGTSCSSIDISAGGACPG
ncbi:MAG TPA: hypothetical protein VGM56_22695 [Byssovorax sp.]